MPDALWSSCRLRSMKDTTATTPSCMNRRGLIQTYGRGGFGFLTRAAVFPHFDKRGSAAAVKFSAEYPHQLGIGIDEETGLIVKGDRAEVIGQGTVSIYDGRRRNDANP